MPAFFPEILPDELLYSAIARYGQMVAYPSVRSLQRDLFGDSTRNAAPVGLPTRLNAFVARLPPGHSYTTDDVIALMTCFRYYEPFCSEAKAARARAMMRGDILGSIWMAIKPEAGNIRVPTYLQFCHTCADEDEQRWGTSYWRRVHQLPGMYVCPNHGCVLWQSETWHRGVHTRQRRYVALQEARERGCAVEFRSEDQPSALRLAQDSDWLLATDVGPIGPAMLSGRLQSVLRATGFCDRWGRVHFAELQRSCLKFYGASFLDAVGAQISHNDVRRGWLRWVVEARARHPLHYLLLVQLLGISIGDLLYPDVAVSPPPRKLSCLSAPCGNILCAQFQGPVPAALAATETAGSTLVEIRCRDCGFTYRHAVVNPRSVRVHALGPLLENRLRELAVQGDLSRAEIGRKLGLSSWLVLQHANRLGVARPDWPVSRSDSLAARQTANKNRYRAAWSKLRAKYPAEGRVALRRRNSKAYAYLYRFDVEWLRANLPPKEQRQLPSRVDWVSRDRHVLSLIKQAVASLSSEPGFPQRVSVSAIERALAGHIPQLGPATLNKMPLTAIHLRAVVESKEDLTRRRIRYCAAEVVASGHTATEEAVMSRMQHHLKVYSVADMRLLIREFLERS